MKSNVSFYNASELFNDIQENITLCIINSTHEGSIGDKRASGERHYVQNGKSTEAVEVDELVF